MINMLKSSYTVSAMVSEEDEQVIEVDVGKQGLLAEWSRNIAKFTRF